MKKSELRKIIKEEIKLLNEIKKEFAIWGIPPGKKDEELLFTKAKTQSEAEKVKEILTKKHNCTKVRIQSFTMNQDIAKDWKRLTTERTHLIDLNTKLNIIMPIVKSDHAEERQYRHKDESGIVITDEDIKETIKAAFVKIMRQLIQNEINIGERILIKNKKNNLNVVVKIKGNTKNKAEIDCDVITVMVHPNFRNKLNSPIIIVSV